MHSDSAKIDTKFYIFLHQQLQISGLNLLPVIKNIRRSASSVPDLGVQLDVFDEQRECDESQSLQGPDGINLSSHLDVFYAILRQVADTPQEIPFLSILQHLLRIDPKEPISDIIWDATETLVHRATLIENRDDAAKLLKTPSIPKFSCPHCMPNGRKSSLGPSASATSIPIVPNNAATVSSTTGVPPPPPPVPAAPPPPPPMAAPPAPPAPPAPKIAHSKTGNEVTKPKTPEPTSDSRTLPQQETPVPRAKMKTINWNKIPQNKLMGTNNIWTLVADAHQDSPMTEMNWDEMEGLFCQQPTQGSPKLGRDSNDGTPERKTKRDNEITLLDGKRSLNVNIFLKQFRSSNEDIIQLIKNGAHDDIGAEKLRGLLKILPEIDELEMLKAFEGDRSRLGNAEKFIMQLIEVPNYKLRIESMLLKEEFASNLNYLQTCINAMLYAGDDLMTNKHLQEVLYMIVVAGNFLNAGGYAGNAAGVKLTSLQKLTEIRANKPGMNLIHFVALQAEKRNPKLLAFPEEISALENASKTTLEQLNNEINTFDNRITKIKKQIDQLTERDIKAQMADFLLAAVNDVSMLQDGMRELEVLRGQLAEFFCEDPNSFKMEECFKIFYQFSEKFRQAVRENEKRRVLEEQAIQRRKQREEQLASKRRQFLSSTPVSDSENGFMDSTYYDIRMSPAMNRRRIGSFNSNGDGSLVKDSESPDITPNGTLRRRRSRVLSEEDEGNLMDFLRSSGHDNSTRERKGASYGSLDRSWARRARSGSNSKKRPDLLNVDFNADRERPSSPSPLAETKPLPGEPPATTSQDSRPREWRQKIESWLQANERDDRQDDEYRRRMRRVTANRRSLETDTESERGGKLDPLPEEKPGQTVLSPDSYKRVYPDWKPTSTIDQTNVEKTLEAIANEDAKPNKDKSAWRKSNLNVSNSTEDAEERRLRRQRSREGGSNGGTLHSIDEEENKRKNIIQSLGDRAATDKLSIYLRRPSDNEPKSPVRSPVSSNQTSSLDSSSNKQSIYIKQGGTTPPAEKHSIYIRQNKESPSTISSVIKVSPEKQSRAEIDADNIETPPTQRRVLNTTCRRFEPRPLHPETLELDSKKALINPAEQEVLGDGQFDRFSAARRTRRFKRPTDYSSGTEERTSSTTPESPPKDVLDTPTTEKSEDRLKQWQHKIKNLDAELEKDADKATSSSISSRIKSTGGRNITKISQEDVRDAIRSLKSPTPDRTWDAKDFKINGPVTVAATKPLTHELNDEGFEETQSLVSDTPSSCNDTTTTDTKGRRKPERLASTDSAATSASDVSRNRRNNTPTSKSNTLQSLLVKNQQSLEKSRSLRGAPPSKISQLATKRATSMRVKPPGSGSLASNEANRRLDVERSSSRASLRSSRSSINSAVSTNTVKKVPLKSSSIGSASSASTNKRPLSTQNVAKTTTRTPASRSSSSGSSIGPNRKTPVKSVAPSHTTSFKENQRESSITRPVRTASTTRSPSTGIGSLSSSASATNRSSTTPSRGFSKPSSSSSFMRPTAASATKVKGK
ncbi:FH2 domain-containing protein 1 isoform X2 [Culicoides brevitarsis]|uniref:FH2 domain-containing protein 1 isoform X2 n=1 Tax=Culicoides brevitarsis TaxID=469753 RepID=UPI00307CC3A7